jgi:hypothetical protein
MKYEVIHLNKPICPGTGFKPLGNVTCSITLKPVILILA